ncbi:hypothetical protein IV55_GL001221 [Furfurilactobacillus siliginis]|nr:hypothetical protein IV55_GL001221 [Furfurilactobacillus siliginis]
MQIGEVAAMTGLSVRTIRFYERKGVVKPSARDANQHRLYDDETIHWLSLVGYLRQTGMSVKALADYYELIQQGPATLNARIDLLQAQRERVVERMAAQKEQLWQIDHKLAHYQDDLTKYV